MMKSLQMCISNYYIPGSRIIMMIRFSEKVNYTLELKEFVEYELTVNKLESFEFAIFLPGMLFPQSSVWKVFLAF